MKNRKRTPQSGRTRPIEYVLALYITGVTPRSQRAITNIKDLCEEHLHGRYSLKVIDIYQQPTLAKGEQILAAPTLIKRLPLPLRRLIGDMSNKQRVLLGLNLSPVEDGDNQSIHEIPTKAKIAKSRRNGRLAGAAQRS